MKPGRMLSIWAVRNLEPVPMRIMDQEQLNPGDDLAHLKGKQLYLTINTLLKNRELETELYEYLAPLYEAGLDAVIVQDPGVMDFVKTYFPGLHIHASTQMTITGVESAKLLQKAGATRVVTARELSLEEIKKFMMPRIWKSRVSFTEPSVIVIPVSA
mgnify:CR=1 FL=1